MRRLSTILLVTIGLLLGLVGPLVADMSASPETPTRQVRDNFGYLLTDSDDPEGPPPVDPSGGLTWQASMPDAGTRLPIDNTFQNAYKPVNMTFSFNFYGSVYSTIYVNRAGYLTFVESDAGYNEPPASGPGDPPSPNEFVAAFYDDLSINTNDPKSGIYYLLYDDYDPDADRSFKVLVIEWHKMRRTVDTSTSPDTVTFQVALVQGTNNIQLRYLDTDTSLTSPIGAFGKQAMVSMENKMESPSQSIWLSYCYKTGQFENEDPPIPACDIPNLHVIDISHPDARGALPDIQVSGSANPTVRPEGLLTYTINFVNYGERLAAGVKVTNTLPLSVTLDRVEAPFDYVQNGRNIYWTWAPMPIFDGRNIITQTIRLYAHANSDVRVDPDRPLLNVVSVGHAMTDANQLDNTLTLQTRVIPGPPHHMVITHSPFTVTANGASNTNVNFRVEDQAGNGVEDGIQVRITTTLGTWSGGQQTRSTGTSNGSATSSLIAGYKTGTAQISASTSNGAVLGSHTVQFSAALPTTLTVTANPGVIRPNGIATTTVVVQGFDQYGYRVSDGTVINISSSALGTINPASATTINGFATFTFRAGTTEGVATVTATSNGRTGQGNVILSNTSVCTSPQDVNGDGRIDAQDVQAVAAAWRTRVGQTGYSVYYDLYYDRIITVFDVMMAAEGFGQPCS